MQEILTQNLGIVYLYFQYIQKICRNIASKSGLLCNTSAFFGYYIYRELPESLRHASPVTAPEMIQRKREMNEKLISEAISGSREAFCGLYGLYKDRLYRYALYRLGSPEDAEDAVSECVLQAWKGITGLRDPKAFVTWMFRILSACCAKRIREMVSLRDNIERIYSEGPQAASAASVITAVELSEALGRLTAEEREIVLLSSVAGLKSSEISEITGLSAGSVRSKLSRSLAKMREFLTQGEK